MSGIKECADWVIFPDQLKSVSITDIENAVAKAVGDLINFPVESKISEIDLTPLSGASIKLRITQPTSRLFGREDSPGD